MNAERRRQADILRYWHAVEMFSPQRVPRADRKKRVQPLDAGKLAPWEEGHPVRHTEPERGRTWQHVVYGGIYELAAVRDTLVDVFGRAPDAYDEQVSGESAMFAFTVDEEGRVLLDSTTISSCAWALGRVRVPGGRDRLDGFDEAARSLAVRIGELGLPDEPDRPADDPLTGLVDDAVSGVTGAVGHAAGAVTGAALGPLAGAVAGRLAATATGAVLDSALGTDGEPPWLAEYPVTGADVLAFTARLAEEWGIGDLGALDVRVKSVQVSVRNADKADQQDFLNSFCLADLARVADAVGATAPGPALATYLTPAARVDTSARVDVLADPDAADGALGPGAAPSGRWPAEHPLARSQQFAVNTMRRELADAGLFSVNGPPGTGKTTMLRDVLADLVVRRAEVLAALPSPGAAFLPAPLAATSGSRTLRVWPLRPELTGYEVVVASANNGAVENISRSIPARDEIGARWRPDADYLAEHASRLLKGEPAWAALAAVLGNMTNRGEFVHRFWWGDEEAGDRQPDGTRRRRAPKRWQPTKQGFHHQLGSWRDEVGQPSWAQACAPFTDAVRRVRELTEARDEAARAIADLPRARQARDEACGQRDATRHTVSALDAELADLRLRYAAADRAETETQARLAAHRHSRPGWFSSRATKRSWREREEMLAGELGAATETRAELAARHADREVHRARTVRAADEATATAAARAAEADRLTGVLTAARRAWPDHVPEPGADEDVRELSAPWSDDELSRARAEVFLAALELHKQFARLAARKMAANLGAAMDVVGGGASGLPDAVVRAAWQSLFLVVPLVSTTFASLDRLFRGLGQDSLGWLFIDEAGQATPQQAVGALWRSRRAVIVGDPLQLEPVTVLPWSGQEALRADHGVAPEWAAKATSAQRIADRTSRFGGTLGAEQPDGTDTVWVGAPLRVHRRCDQPMFTMSNTMAYGGKMVFGTPDRGGFPAPPSSWANVESTDTDGHWVPAEGRALLRILEKLRERGITPAQVYVISPFRRVVGGVEQLVRARAGSYWQPLAAFDAGRVGTVHRTQGKEADVVILILGSDPAKPGARRWVNERPNLINVAVSRAKRRLYVVGNREQWLGQRFTGVVARHLPHHDFTD
ncbi:MAG TPA: ATP-binding protein [Actinocatenispora sp.]